MHVFSFFNCIYGIRIIRANESIVSDVARFGVPCRTMSNEYAIKEGGLATQMPTTIGVRHLCICLSLNVRFMDGRLCSRI